MTTLTDTPTIRPPAIDEDLDVTDGGTDYTGWWCVATDPWPCARCGVVVHYMTAAHMVVVWPARDDPNLLHHAGRAQRAGRNPRVVAYERSMGTPLPYYAWESHGRPVCGIRGGKGAGDRL